MINIHLILTILKIWTLLNIGKLTFKQNIYKYTFNSDHPLNIVTSSLKKTIVNTLTETSSASGKSQLSVSGTLKVAVLVGKH